MQNWTLLVDKNRCLQNFIMPTHWCLQITMSLVLQELFTGWHSCLTETAAVGQKATTPVSEPEPALVEDESAAAQCPDKFYWITTLPSGERTAHSCCDQTDVNVINATVCIMTDPLSSQVYSWQLVILTDRWLTKCLDLPTSVGLCRWLDYPAA